MFDTQKIEEIAQKLYHELPSSIESIENDVKSTFKSILAATFQELNLVTREEFDAQVKVLMRTREKVEALEKQLSELKL